MLLKYLLNLILNLRFNIIIFVCQVWWNSWGCLSL